jgi:hypothetical protein
MIKALESIEGDKTLTIAMPQLALLKIRRTNLQK